MTKTNKPVVKRMDGYLHKLTPIVDSTGKVINHMMTFGEQT